MGYSVSGGGTIVVRPHQEAEAVAALQRWATSDEVQHPGQVGYAGPDQLAAIMAATTVADVFAQFGGMGVAADESKPGTFDVDHGDSWSEDYDAAASVIAPYVEPGTVNWTGEDDEHFRWRFTGTEMVEEYGSVVYGADRTALDEIAAILRAADWSMVMYDGDALDAIHELITATGRDAGDPGVAS